MRVNRIVGAAAAISLALLLVAQTKIERDANGHIVISNTPATTATTATTSTQPPAAVPSPSVSVTPTPIYVPPPQPPTPTSEALSDLPFSFSDGDSSIASISLGLLPRAIGLFKAPDGHAFAVRGLAASSEAGGPFPYHVPSLRSISRVVAVAGGEHANTTYEGVHPTGEKLIYYFGRDNVRIPVYEGVQLHGAAHNIDLTETLTPVEQRIHLTIAAGTNLAKIGVTWDESASLSLDTDGSLIVRNTQANVQARTAKLRATQKLNGDITEIGARWKPTEFRESYIEFGSTDPSQPIDVDFDVHRWVIDPSQPPQSSFKPEGAITTDDDGNVYVAAKARGPDHDSLSSAGITPSRGGLLGVQKFDAKGKLVYTTLIDGLAASGLVSIRPDGHGKLWVAFVQNIGGMRIAKLSAGGDVVESTTSHAIPDPDLLLIDSRGVIYAATQKSYMSLSPATMERGFQPVKMERSPGLIAAIFDSKNLRYATYLGGVMPLAIAYDADGRMAVGGDGAIDSKTGGSGSGCVVVIDPSKEGAESLAGATRIGGTNAVMPDELNAVAFDRAGNVYAAGVTSSADFPATKDAWHRELVGASDAFVCKFDRNLRSLRWATFAGGSRNDRAIALAVDPNENVYVVGTTESQDFKIENAPSHDLENGSYTFAVRINSIGTAATWSLIAGGGGADIERPHDATAVATGGGDLLIATRAPFLDLMSPIDYAETTETYETFVRVASCVVCTQPPSITRVSKGFGSKITIDGSNFLPASQVIINGTPASAVSFESPKRLTADYAKKDDGALEVSVVNPDHASATSSDVQPSLIAQKRVFVPGLVVILIILIAAASRRRRGG